VAATGCYWTATRSISKTAARLGERIITLLAAIPAVPFLLSAFQVSGLSLLPHFCILPSSFLCGPTLGNRVKRPSTLKVVESNWCLHCREHQAGLHLLELIGRRSGAFLAQRRLRHKCSKVSYQVVFWLIAMACQFAAYDSL
jgi:hypothetical protein